MNFKRENWLWTFVLMGNNSKTWHTVQMHNFYAINISDTGCNDLTSFLGMVHQLYILCIDFTTYLRCDVLIIQPSWIKTCYCQIWSIEITSRKFRCLWELLPAHKSVLIIHHHKWHGYWFCEKNWRMRFW